MVQQGLEIGPGPGCISQKIKENFGQISFTAIEPSLDWAKIQANSAVFDAFFGNIGDLAEQEKFDLILSSHSLKHVPDLTAWGHLWTEPEQAIEGSGNEGRNENGDVV